MIRSLFAGDAGRFGVVSGGLPPSPPEPGGRPRRRRTPEEEDWAYEGAAIVVAVFLDALVSLGAWLTPELPTLRLLIPLPSGLLAVGLWLAALWHYSRDVEDLPRQLFNTGWLLCAGSALVWVFFAFQAEYTYSQMVPYISAFSPVWL